MKMKYKLLSIAMLVGIAQVAQADFAPYGAAEGNYVFPDSARNEDDGGGFTLLLGLPLNEYLAPEISFFGMFPGRKGSSVSDSQWGGGLDLAIFPLKRSGVVTPFLLVGGGSQYEDTFLQDHNYGYLNAGGGLLFGLNAAKTVSIRLDAKRYWVFNNDTDPSRNHLMDTRIGLGLQAELGPLFKRHTKTVVVPVTAPVADTDSDGVLDPVDQCPGTPKGTPVDKIGCPVKAAKDSDGDGVDDSIDACPDTPRGFTVDARGCATREAKIILRDLNFEFDSSRLQATSKAELDKIAAGLKGQPSMGLVIEGHTDATGSDAYNMKLSKERANAARTYLISQGIEGSRLEANGYGETKPVATNKTKDGRAENRRVEFKVSKE